MTMSLNEIYADLESDIFNLKIMPGQPLVEGELCERYGVSRTPIRGVLQLLNQKKLVETLPYKGTTVTLLDYDIISQMIYLRVALECRVLKDFMAVATPADLERIRYFLDSMESAAAVIPPDSKSCLAADFQMHLAWFSPLNKTNLLNRIINDPFYGRFCMLDVAEQTAVEHTVSEHQQIAEAIFSRDLEGLDAIVHHHLYGGIRRLGPRLHTDFKEYFTDFDTDPKRL